MHIALIADAYPPDQNSAAVQLRDLSKEFVAQGYDVLVIRPSSKISSYNKMDIIDGVQVLSLYAPNTKEPGYFRRTINEILMPIFMVLNFLRTAQKNKRLDAVVWYSPSIFHGFLLASNPWQCVWETYPKVRPTMASTLIILVGRS